MTSGMGRSPGEGKGYPLQYSGLENAMDCIIHGAAESDATEQLSLSLCADPFLESYMSPCHSIKLLTIISSSCLCLSCLLARKSSETSQPEHLSSPNPHPLLERAKEASCSLFQNPTEQEHRFFPCCLETNNL